VDDINNDGYKELVVFRGGNPNRLTAYRYDASMLWSTAVDSGYFSGTLPILINYNGTSSKEIVVLSTPDDTDRYASVNAYDTKGNLIWSTRIDFGGETGISAADLNNDGKQEIVFGSCDNCIYALDGTGKKLWSYETDFWVVASPIVTDIDNDGKLEIIAGSYDHNIYVLDSEGSYMLDYVPGVSGIVGQTGQYGDAITKEPGKTQGKKIWQYQTEGIVVGCAYVKNNIIVNTDSGKINNIMHKTDG
jgi:hypothetical protein